MVALGPRVVGGVWVAAGSWFPERVGVFHLLGCHRRRMGGRRLFASWRTGSARWGLDAAGGGGIEGDGVCVAGGVGGGVYADLEGGVGIASR